MDSFTIDGIIYEVIDIKHFADGTILYGIDRDGNEETWTIWN